MFTYRVDGQSAGDVDFTLWQDKQLAWHWEGESDEFGEYASQRGFGSKRIAAADAIFNLSVRVDGLSHLDAYELVRSHNLPTASIQRLMSRG